jgi:hypothetical protein
LACIDRRKTGLILRTRALAGDTEPEPLGAIYAALIAVEGKGAISFVARFLNEGGDPAQEAALALGATHEPAALELLQSALHRQADPALRLTLMTAIALTRLPEAIEFLIAQVSSGSREAGQALQDVPLPEAQRARLEEARKNRE